MSSQKIKVIILGSGYKALQEKFEDEHGNINPIMSRLYSFGVEDVDVDSVSLNEPRTAIEHISGNRFNIQIKRMQKDIGNFYMNMSDEQKIASLEGTLEMMAYWQENISSHHYDGIIVINGDGDGNVEPLYRAYRRANINNPRVLFIDWCTCCVAADASHNRPASRDNLDSAASRYHFWGPENIRCGSPSTFTINDFGSTDDIAVCLQQSNVDNPSTEERCTPKRKRLRTFAHSPHLLKGETSHLQGDMINWHNAITGTDTPLAAAASAMLYTDETFHALCQEKLTTLRANLNQALNEQDVFNANLPTNDTTASTEQAQASDGETDDETSAYNTPTDDEGEYNFSP